MSAETNATTLYRIENPNIPARPDGVVSHEDLVGQWFSPNLSTATLYLRKATQTFGKDRKVVPGAQLVIAEVPTDELDARHVSENPIASAMDTEGDNYIVPRDGTYPLTTVPLDETLGDLRSDLGNISKLVEARRRIGEFVLPELVSN